MNRRVPASGTPVEAAEESLWAIGARFVLAWRRPVLAATFALSLFFGWQAAQLRPVWNEQTEFSPRDRYYGQFLRFLNLFGGQDHLVVLLQTDDVFTPDFLAHLADLSEALRDVPHALDVVSLATVSVARGGAAGVRIEPFYADPPATSDEAARLKREALARAPWIGTLVAADGRAACINVMLPAMSADSTLRLETAAIIREILDRHAHPGVAASCTGYSPLALDMHRAIIRDLARFSCLMPLLVLVCLRRAFRTWRAVWVPALVVAASVAWSLGILRLSGGTLGVGTVMLPTLVAVNALSYSIHFLNEYHHGCARGGDPQRILVETARHVGPALAMAALTTAIGFGTLLLSELRSLRELGTYSAVGILASFGLGLVVIPALLAGLPLPSPSAHRHREIRWLRAGLWRLAAIANRDRWKIPVALVLLVLVALAGIRRVPVETQWTRYLPGSMPSMRSLRALQETMAGFVLLEVVLEAEPGVFRRPAGLDQIERFAQHVAVLDGVNKVLTANDVFREIGRARNWGSADGLPTNESQIAECRLLLAAAGREYLLDGCLTPDGSAARVTVRVGSMGTAEQLRLAAAIEDVAARRLEAGTRFYVTGVARLFAVKVDALVRSLFRSFGLTFLLLAGLFSILLRSLKGGLCAMVPNVLPVLAGFGGMGFAGIPLTGATVMVASVGIGIAVDDTIHLLLRYRRELCGGRTPGNAVRHALLGTGRAMV